MSYFRSSPIPYCHDCFWCLQPTTKIDGINNPDDYPQFNEWDRECKNHGVKIQFMIDSIYRPFYGVNLYVDRNLAIHYQIEKNQVSLWSVSIKNIEINNHTWDEMAKLPTEFILRDIPTIISKTNNIIAFT